jgi:hypothetical protein
MKPRDAKSSSSRSPHGSVRDISAFAARVASLTCACAGLIRARPSAAAIAIRIVSPCSPQAAPTAVVAQR